jgi:hypothetical protein
MICYYCCKGYQWRKDRKIIGTSFRNRSYFEEVLSRTNAVTKDLLAFLKKSLAIQGKNGFVNHHHDLFLPASMKVAAGK